jgi:GTPase
LEEFKQMAAQNCKDENDVRVAVIGNVDSGKSTIVGVLTKHIMDDGRGSARKLVFNFNHEQQNGRTSSIG